MLQQFDLKINFTQKIYVKKFGKKLFLKSLSLFVYLQCIIIIIVKEDK